VVIYNVSDVFTTYAVAVQLNATLSEVAMVTGRLQQLNKELSSNLSSIADDLSRVCDNIDCEDNNLQALIKNLHTDVNFSDVSTCLLFYVYIGM
jgi:hypothetical protein